MNTDALLRSGRRTVLIVEDEAVNRKLLGLILGESYNLLYAENGQEAVELVRGYAGHISMILLDIMMPVMNGIEYLKLRAQDETLGKVPVIVLTADKNSELESLKLGAMDYIMKPYDMPEIILARVRRIIEFVEDRQIISDVEHDPLTGLYSRGFFFEYCRRLAAADGEAAHRDMVALDIDHFHLVNEVYGKTFGDAALCAVAEGIRRALEGRFGFGCRSDADLFYIYLDHIEDCQAFCDGIMEMIQLKLGSQANVRLRMGVCPGVDAARGVDWCADAAKSACDIIRNDFRRNVMIYDNELHQHELLNERLIGDMDEALEQRQFVVHFQPKYDIRGDRPRLTSAEALVRWNHPELGFISPGKFIPLFEGNGLILKLDDYVWRESARQIREWHDRYGVKIPVSVNVSRMDFFDAHLRERFVKIVEENGIGVEDIVMEVTESAYSQNMDQMIDALASLRKLGFKVEMDDFGSGYSSLNMLCVMPLDAMKIDMKFVQNMVHTGSGYRIVELVIEMARSLGIPTIVEGVEDEEQYRLMKRAGCDIVQGFYFSRPLAPADFEKLLEHNGED